MQERTPRGRVSSAGSADPWEEWEIPREAGADWPDEAKKLHAEWWEARIARQKEIDASIAAKAEFEYLYDKPYADNSRIRVAGPFTVESLSPHRYVAGDADDSLIDEASPSRGAECGEERFRADGARKPEGRRGAAGAQGRPHRLHRADAVARAN